MRGLSRKRGNPLCDTSKFCYFPCAYIVPQKISYMVVRDAQKFGKLHAVGAGLIEHDEKLAVRQHGARRMGLEQVVHVLR